MDNQLGIYLFATATEALNAATQALAYLNEYEQTGSEEAAANYLKTTGCEVGDAEENFYAARNLRDAVSLYTKKVEQGY